MRMLNKAKQDKQQTIKEDKFTLSRLDVPLTSFSDQMEVYRKMINSFPLKELSLIYFLFKLDIYLTKSFMLVQDVFFCFFLVVCSLVKVAISVSISAQQIT